MASAQHIDTARLREQRAQSANKEYEGFGGDRERYPFNILWITKLPEGIYPFRLLWTVPIVNELGTYLHATHRVLMDGKSDQFLAADYMPEGQRYHGVDHVLGLIDQYGMFKKLKDDPNANPKGSKNPVTGKYEPSPRSLCEVIRKLGRWKRYWLPGFLWAEEVPPPTADDFATFRPIPGIDPNRPHGKPLDVMLEIGFDLAMIDALTAERTGFFDAYPDLCHHATGRNLIITVKKGRRNSYGLDVSQPCPLDPSLIAYASEHYPNMAEVARKKYGRTPTEIYSKLQSQWWFPQFVNLNDGNPDPYKNLDGTDKGMGLVFPLPQVSIPVSVPLSAQPAAATPTPAPVMAAAPYSPPVLPPPAAVTPTYQQQSPAPLPMAPVAPPAPPIAAYQPPMVAPPPPAPAVPVFKPSFTF